MQELLALADGRSVDVHAKDRAGFEAGFRWACRNGHANVVRVLLALTGDRAVDVHAGLEGKPDYAWRWACHNGHLEVVRELLHLTGHRAVPREFLRTDREIVRSLKNAIWNGTTSLHGRRAMVLLRVVQRKQA